MSNDKPRLLTFPMSAQANDYPNLEPSRGEAPSSTGKPPPDSPPKPSPPMSPGGLANSTDSTESQDHPGDQPTTRMSDGEPATTPNPSPTTGSASSPLSSATRWSPGPKPLMLTDEDYPAFIVETGQRFLAVLNTEMTELANSCEKAGGRTYDDERTMCLYESARLATVNLIVSAQMVLDQESGQSGLWMPDQTIVDKHGRPLVSPPTTIPEGMPHD